MAGVKVGELTYDVTGDASRLRAVLVAAAEEARATMAGIDGQSADMSVQLDLKRLEAAASRAEAIIKAIDGQEANVEFKGDAKGLNKAVAEVRQGMTKSTLAITKHNAELAQLRQEYAKLATARAKVNKQDLGRQTNRETLEYDRLDTAMSHIGARIRSMSGDTRDLNVDLDKNNFSLSSFGNRLRTIGRTRVNLGPISTSLRNLTIAGATLSPILIGLVGSASALAGAIGAGLVGAFGVAAGAFTGFAIAAVGLLPSLKQLFTEAKAAPSIVGPLRQMRDSLTGGIRQPFFAAAHSAIQTLKADFPTFKAGATSAFGAASKGFQGWMKGLRSPEAQGILKNLLGNVTKDLGPAMKGLGSLTTAFGRFINIASNSGPGISHTFADWASGIERGTRAGTGFADKVNNLVGQAKSLGSALTATGRLTVAFFGAGAKSGQDLLQSLTRSENRMTHWIHSVEGQKSLGTFFKDAVANTKALFSAVGPLVTTFVRLGNALSPVTTGILEFATFIGDLVHAVAQLAPARVTLEGFGVILGGLFVASKVAGYTSKIREAAVALGILTAAEEASAVAGATNAGQMALFGGRLSALGSISGGTAAAIALPIAAFAGLVIWAGKSATTLDVARASVGHYHDIVKQLPGSIRNLTKVSRDSIQADQAASDAKDKLFHVTQKFIKGDASLTAVQQAQAKVNTTQQRATTQTQAQAKAQQAAVTSAERVAQAQKDVADAQKAVNSGRTVSSKAGQGTLPADPAAIRNLADANNTLADAQANQTFDQINQARAMNGLNQIAPTVAKNFRALQDVMGKQKAAKFALTTDPGTTGKVAKLTADLQHLGVTKKAKLVLQGAKSPEAALRGLQKLDQKTLRSKSLKINHAAAVAAAERGLNKVDAKRLRQKALRILTNTNDPKRAFAFLEGKKLPDKEQKFKPGSPAAVLSTYNELSGKPPIIIEVQFHGSKTGNWSGAGGHFAGGIVQGFAEGGTFERMMARAYDLAGRVSGIDPAGGARVRSPRYVVGEEAGRTEYIITDNPAYRRSNLEYLQEAAGALGQALVPGYKTGKGNGKKAARKQLKNNPDPGTSPEAIAWDNLSADQQFWSDEYDLDRRAYDGAVGRGGTEGGFDLASLIGDIDMQIGDYTNMIPLIERLRKLDKKPDIKVPSNLKSKNLKGQLAKRQKQIDAYNESLDSAKGDATALREGDNLRHLIAGLQQEKAEIQGAAATNTLVGQTSANEALYALRFGGPMGSNITAPVSGSSPGGALSVPPGSTPPSPGYVRGATPSGTRSTIGNSSGDTIINNTFAGPPPDPLTWSSSLAFTLSMLP